MGRGKQLSIMQRGQIVVLLSEGLSQRYIANKLGVSQCAVAYTAKKQVQTGQVVDRKRSGRPRVSSIRTDNLIHRYSLANPSISSSEIHSELNNSGLDPPSSRTIRRRLCNTFGLRARKPARKPYLTAVQRKKRIDFCKIHQNWTADMWRSVEFSDETAVSQFKTYRPFVRRPPGTRLSPKYLLPMVKHPQTTMIWGCFSHAGTGPLHFVPKNTTVTGASYKSLLTELLPPALQTSGCSIFQHDGAPAHRSKTVQEWFATNNIQQLAWPGNSPDLNPIENLWAVLKRKVALHRPTCSEHLKQVIRQAWETEIDRELCERLVDSMPDRIQAVLHAKGFPTKY